jgi:hypothetical protein
VEGTKRALLLRFPKQLLRTFAYIMTALVYLPVYTFYLLPLSWLPYFEYFRAWRTFSFERNAMNVFDKLNAPTTHFSVIKRSPNGSMRDNLPTFICRTSEG